MNIYELIGFIIGDGYLYHNKRCRFYKLEFVGNVEEDYDYFEKVAKFLTSTTGKKSVVKIVESKGRKALRIIFYNKEFVEKLCSMGLPLGKKTFTIQIPEDMINRENMISILRGLFEADGCLYFSKSKKINYPTYPRIEIKTSSPKLVTQVKTFLESEGFVVYIKKPKRDRTFAILLSGEKMLEKWRALICFVSQKNITKFRLWKAKGFYIPHTPLKQRQELCADGEVANALDS